MAGVPTHRSKDTPGAAASRLTGRLAQPGWLRAGPSRFDYPSACAGVAELADAADLNSAVRKDVRVQIPAPAPRSIGIRGEWCGHRASGVSPRRQVLGPASDSGVAHGSLVFRYGDPIRTASFPRRCSHRAAGFVVWSVSWRASRGRCESARPCQAESATRTGLSGDGGTGRPIGARPARQADRRHPGRRPCRSGGPAAPPRSIALRRSRPGSPR